MIEVILDPQVDSEIAKMQHDIMAWLKAKNDEFLQRLLEEGKRVAERYFGNAVTVTVDKTATGYALVAEGEAVCFLEFGTGVYAEPVGDVFEQYMPFTIEAGSWSESEFGAGTWSRHIANGGTPENYPYNRQAKHGMWEAYKTILESADRIAKEVYK